MEEKNKLTATSINLLLKSSKAEQTKMLYDVVELVVDQLCGICIIVNTDGLITYANHGFCEMVQRPRLRVINSHFKQYVHPEDIDDTFRVFAEIEERGLTEPYLNRYKSGAGWQTIAWGASPAEWREQRISIGWKVSGKDDPMIQRLKKCSK